MEILNQISTAAASEFQYSLVASSNDTPIAEESSNGSLAFTKPAGSGITGGVITANSGDLYLYSAGGTVHVRDNLDTSFQATDFSIKDNVAESLTFQESKGVEERELFDSHVVEAERIYRERWIDWENEKIREVGFQC